MTASFLQSAKLATMIGINQQGSFIMRETVGRDTKLSNVQMVSGSTQPRTDPGLVDKVASLLAHRDLTAIVAFIACSFWPTPPMAFGLPYGRVLSLPAPGTGCACRSWWFLRCLCGVLICDGSP